MFAVAFVYFASCICFLLYDWLLAHQRSVYFWLYLNSNIRSHEILRKCRTVMMWDDSNVRNKYTSGHFLGPCYNIVSKFSLINLQDVHKIHNILLYNFQEESLFRHLMRYFKTNWCEISSRKIKLLAKSFASYELLPKSAI